MELWRVSFENIMFENVVCALGKKEARVPGNV